MALEKIAIIDQIEVVGDHAIQVREVIRVMDDGVQIGGDAYHRHVILPPDDWSNEDAKVKKICDALFDDDCIEAYQGFPVGEPTGAWTKAQLQKYCADRSIDYEESDTKAELVTKIESA